MDNIISLSDVKIDNIKKEQAEIKKIADHLLSLPAAPGTTLYILNKIAERYEKAKVMYAEDEAGKMYRGIVDDHEFDWLISKVLKTIAFAKLIND